MVGTWELYLLAFALLAIPLVSWLLMLLSRDGTVASRTLHPSPLKRGAHGTLYLRLANTTLLPGPQVAVRDPAGELDPAVGMVESESLRPRGARTLAVPLQAARRGVHRLPPLQLEEHDPLGLVRTSRQGDEERTFVVYPRLTVLESFVLIHDTDHRERTGNAGPAAPGGLDFRGIRPHYPGEPLSRVDWKATARSGSLMLRETDEPANGDVTLVLDGARAAVAGDPPDTSFELAVEVAAAVGDYLLRGRRTIHLVLHQEASRPLRIAPGGGARALLLEHLAAAQADAALPVAATLAGLHTLAGAGRLRSLVLVTSAPDGGLTRALKEVRDQGIGASVVHVDRGSFLHEPMAGDWDIDAGVPSPALLALARAGVPCITVGRGDDLRAVLSEARIPAGGAAR